MKVIRWTDHQERGTMKSTVRIKDKFFEPMISEQEIMDEVDRVAHKINIDYKEKDPLFLCILNGSFVFAADLLRRIQIPCRVSFVRYASYSGASSTQYVRNLIGLGEDQAGQDGIHVEDHIDTGLTMSFLLKELAGRSPASVKIAALFFKKDAFRAGFVIDYLGREVPDEFIIGYGLDYDGYGRNLKGIYQLSKTEKK